MRTQWLGKIFIALYISVGAYCLLSVIAGPAGLIAHRELASRQAAMLENLEQLRATNENLRAELDSLRSDPERASLEARALGYLAPGETALILAGDQGQRGLRRLNPGTVVKLKAPQSMSDGLIKEVSILVGLVALGISLSPSLKSRNLRLGPRKRESQAPRGQSFQI